MRYLALLLIVPLAFAGPLDVAIGALSNVSSVVQQALSSPVAPVKVAATLYVNASYWAEALKGAKALSESCFNAFSKAVTELDNGLGSSLISPLKAESLLGKMRFEKACYAFAGSFVEKVYGEMKSSLPRVVCLNATESMKVLKELLNVKSVKEYLKLVDEVKRLGGVKGVLGCYVKEELGKAVNSLKAWLDSWKVTLKNMNDMFNKYEAVVEKYVASLR